MKQSNRETGKGLLVGALLASAIAGVMKLIDKHFAKKEKEDK